MLVGVWGLGSRVYGLGGGGGEGGCWGLEATLTLLQQYVVAVFFV